MIVNKTYKWMLPLLVHNSYKGHNSISADRHGGVDDVPNICRNVAIAGTETRRKDDVLQDLRDEPMLRLGCDLVAVSANVLDPKGRRRTLYQPVLHRLRQGTLLIFILWLLLDHGFLVDEDGSGWTGTGDGGLRFRELLVEIVQLVRSVCAVLKPHISPPSRIATPGIKKVHTEMRALWLSVFTQYLFHNSPSSSESNDDLKICTSRG